ncbi:TatD family hydrolase [Porphyromonas gingivicanis]|uniref:TatD family hydrolase n=1 Tax=Porphyromonas gingivicanis TaxID=266762 RepID=UPI000470A7AA|nr:TatD family hydrolase [Porphyromonas gingivicanis]
MGLHPWHIEQATLQKLLYLLEHYAQQENILMLGEIGLDRNSRVDMELQKSAFEMQCQIAYQHHLPCILHIVKAWEELFATLKRLGREQPLFIIHAFEESPIWQRVLLTRGFTFHSEATIRKNLCS